MTPQDIIMRIEGLHPPTPKEIAISITDIRWRAWRSQMRGRPTHIKLDMLIEYLEKDPHDRGRQVRTYNYLQALKRGGFINSEGKVMK